MIGTQRIIKYFGMALAIFLTFNIIVSIMYGIMSIGNLFDDNEDILKGDFKSIEISNNIKDMEIDVKSVNIIIREGNSFLIETDSNYIDIKDNNNKLLIEERKSSLFNNNEGDIVIYIPNGYSFREVSIDNGAGRIITEKLTTDELDMELGAGGVELDNLVIYKNMNIDGGAGEIVVTNSEINYLDVDMGVGKLSLTASIGLLAEIGAGVGKMDIELIGTTDDYKIKVDKGLGSATLDGIDMSSNTYYGTGKALIDISGGIGNIDISFK